MLPGGCICLTARQTHGPLSLTCLSTGRASVSEEWILPLNTPHTARQASGSGICGSLASRAGRDLRGFPGVSLHVADEKTEALERSRHPPSEEQGWDEIRTGRPWVWPTPLLPTSFQLHKRPRSALCVWAELGGVSLSSAIRDRQSQEAGLWHLCVIIKHCGWWCLCFLPACSFLYASLFRSPL